MRDFFTQYSLDRVRIGVPTSSVIPNTSITDCMKYKATRRVSPYPMDMAPIWTLRLPFTRKHRHVFVPPVTQATNYSTPRWRLSNVGGCHRPSTPQSLSTPLLRLPNQTPDWHIPTQPGAGNDPGIRSVAKSVIARMTSFTPHVQIDFG